MEEERERERERGRYWKCGPTSHIGGRGRPLDALRGRDGGVRFALQVLLLLQDDCGAPPDVVLPEELHTVAAHF